MKVYRVNTSCETPDGNGGRKQVFAALGGQEGKRPRFMLEEFHGKPFSRQWKRSGIGWTNQCFRDRSHAGRMNYQKVAARGWPIGSGAVESACAQKQGRLKRPGQFWTRSGLRHLNALMEARDNSHWDELWLSA